MSKLLSIDCKNKNYLLLKCKFEDKEKAKSISDAQWDKDLKSWRFPATSFKLKKLCEIFPDLQVEKDVENVIRENKEIDKQSLQLKTLSDCDLDIKNLKTCLFSYQKVGVKFMLTRNEAANFCELGTGKTLQTLATIVEHKQHQRISRCLVVAPASVKYNWRNEIELHTFEKSIVIDGSKKKRLEQYEEYRKNTDILFLVTNYELLRMDIDLLTKYLDFDAIVIDESVKIKNPLAQQTKAVKRFSHKKYKYILSGYPIANNAIDIWSQIDFLRPGYLGSYWSFEDNYVDRGYFKEIVGYRNLDILKKKLEPLYIRFLKKDVLDLPDKIYTTRESIIEGDQLKAYEQMRDEMRVSIEKMGEEEVIAKTREILTMLIRLSQITSGFITDKCLENPYAFEKNSKLDILTDIVEEVINNNKPIVIWCRFLPTVELLNNTFKDKYSVSVLTGDTHTRDRQKIIDDFQNGKTNIFIGQILAGGMGINLFKADTEVFFEKSFLSPSSIIQAEDRLHRIGQKNNVTVISLVSKNTIDEKWEKLLEKKRDVAEQILGDKVMRINKQMVLDLIGEELE